MKAKTYPVKGMKTEAMQHQFNALAASLNKRNFAYLMEQGTGKTWTTLADAVRLFLQGRVDALLIVAPKGVHTNWILREIPTHVAIKTLSVDWRGRPTSKKARARLDRLYAETFADEKVLRVFAINVDAINHQAGYDEVLRFLETFKVCAIVDESTRIKNPQAKRAKKIVKLGEKAVARRILSGTPLTRAPTDLFMQFQFLRDGILGTKSYRAFVAEFSVLVPSDDPRMIAIMRKLEGKQTMPPQLVEKDERGRPVFRNLDKLRSLIEPHSFRVTKKEALPFLPDKVYKRIYFEMSPEQRKVYQRVEEDYHFVLKNEDFMLDVSFDAAAARSKLKQVASGYINVYGEPVILSPEDNPRFAVFTDLLEGLLEEDPERSIIIWAMRIQEIDQIKAYLEAQGISFGTYYGETKEAEREKLIDDFQAKRVQVFLGNPAAAGIGITLTAADVAIYYTTDEDNELRMQSEDRNHRIGTVNSVLYFDLICLDSIDEKIQVSLEWKRNLASYVVDGVFEADVSTRDEI